MGNLRGRLLGIATPISAAAGALHREREKRAVPRAGPKDLAIIEHAAARERSEFLFIST